MEEKGEGQSRNVGNFQKLQLIQSWNIEDETRGNEMEEKFEVTRSKSFLI
jgi:hypothetical protein